MVDGGTGEQSTKPAQIRECESLPTAFSSRPQIHGRRWDPCAGNLKAGSLGQIEGLHKMVTEPPEECHSPLDIAYRVSPVANRCGLSLASPTVAHCGGERLG